MVTEHTAQFAGGLGMARKLSDLEYLLKRRYPLWGVPPMGQRHGTSAAEQLDREARAFQVELLCMSREGILALVDEEQSKEAKENQRRRELDEQGRFFNQLNAMADYDHYCQCTYWSLDEAIALSFGRQPTIVNWKSLSPFLEISDFAKAYALRRDLALRAVGAKQLTDPVYPSVFLSWARATGIPIVEELVRRAVASGISLQGWKDLYENLAEQAGKMAALLAQQATKVTELQSSLDESQRLITSLELKVSELVAQLSSQPVDRPLGTQERENLELLAFLGAVKGYGYDPERRTGAAAALAADTEKLVHRYSDDSIRTHLKSASQFIPRNWRERLGLKPNSGKA